MRMFSREDTKWYKGGRLVALNTDTDHCGITLKTQHHYGGNIVCPRQGLVEMGAIEIYEK